MVKPKRSKHRARAARPLSRSKLSRSAARKRARLLRRRRTPIAASVVYVNPHNVPVSSILSDECAACLGTGHVLLTVHIVRDAATLWCGTRRDSRAIAGRVREVELAPPPGDLAAAGKEFHELGELNRLTAEIPTLGHPCKVCLQNATARRDSLARRLEYDPGRPEAAIGAMSQGSPSPQQIRSDIRTALAGGKITEAQARRQMRAAPPIPGATKADQRRANALRYKSGSAAGKRAA